MSSYTKCAEAKTEQNMKLEKIESVVVETSLIVNGERHVIRTEDFTDSINEIFEHEGGLTYDEIIAHIFEPV